MVSLGGAEFNSSHLGHFGCVYTAMLTVIPVLPL